jgi:hypothetical protein
VRSGSPEDERSPSKSGHRDPRGCNLVCPQWNLRHRGCWLPAPSLLQSKFHSISTPITSMSYALWMVIKVVSIASMMSSSRRTGRYDVVSNVFASFFALFSALILFLAISASSYPRWIFLEPVQASVVSKMAHTAAQRT